MSVVQAILLAGAVDVNNQKQIHLRFQIRISDKIQVANKQTKP